jgi:hypothetical protein
MVGLFTNRGAVGDEANEDGTVNFNLPQFLKAVGVNVEEGEVKIPNPDKLGGYPVTLRVSKREFPEGSDNWQNEVKAVLPRGGAATKAKAKVEKPKAKDGKMVL